MAHPEGFEPPTNWIGTSYSIQLSYGCAEDLLREGRILLRRCGFGKRKHAVDRRFIALRGRGSIRAQIYYAERASGSAG